MKELEEDLADYKEQLKEQKENVKNLKHERSELMEKMNALRQRINDLESKSTSIPMTVTPSVSAKEKELQSMVDKLTMELKTARSSFST